MVNRAGPRRPTRSQLVDWLAIPILCAAFLFLSAQKPAILRHDWLPVGAGGFLNAIASVSGWDRAGLGSVTSYPSSFIIVPWIALLADVLTPYGAQIVLLATIAGIVVVALQRLTIEQGNSAFIRLGATAATLFNPWVYVQVVAGHLFMLLAYVSTLALIVEITRRKLARVAIVLCFIGIVSQIQFFFVDVIVAVVAAIRFRSATPLLVWSALALPIAVGVFTSAASLAATPLTVAWETSQSVPLLKAIVLRGYFTQYDLRLPPWIDVIMWTIVASAALGAAFALFRDKRATFIIFFTIALLIFASGTTGPAASTVVYAFLHVPAAGLFRELYDLIGFVAICYIGLGVYAATRLVWLAPVYGVVACTLATSWFFAPPLDLAVDARALPHIRLLCQSSERFAMMPAFQPMTFGSAGAGLDPDTRTRTSAIAINSPRLIYPLDRAFALYERDGRSEGLADLGVGEVFDRPYLRTDTNALSGSLALPVPSFFNRIGTGRQRCLAARPLVTLWDGRPRLARLPTPPGEDAVLFSDAAAAEGTDVPRPWRIAGRAFAVAVPRSESFARLGWVDARLAFIERPEIAQPFGGALTTNSVAVLPVKPGIPILAWVEGRLYSERGVRLGSSFDRRYHWLRIAQAVRGLRCDGFCVVATQGEDGSDATATGPEHGAGLHSVQLTPWLWTIPIATQRSGTLRIETTFSSQWVAWLRNRRLTHFRIGGYANGWLVPAGAHGTLYVLNVASALIALAEVTSLATIGLTIVPARRVFRALRRNHANFPARRSHSST